MSSVMPTYGRMPLEVTSGEGIWLFDTEGNAYLDTFTGIAVCSLGHANPQIAQAIARQANTLIHCSNFYHIGNQQKLADKLCKISGMQNVFFGNSGAEANEAAIKLARFYGNQKGISTPTIITTHNSFHGRTMATLSATGNPKVQKGFFPLVEGFIQVAYNDIEAIRTHSSNENIVAVMVEPIQGEGGVNVPASNYLNQIRALCDDNGWLMIIDEIQTGIGRTGKWFGYQHNDIIPDIVTSAKALGNGVPIGACLAQNAAANLFQPGNHGSTYGGNPLSSKVALTVLEIMEQHALLDNAAQRGQKLQGMLQERIGHLPGVLDIRGIGLIIGIELDRECAELMKIALADHVLLNVTQGKVVRLLPALTLTNEEVELIANKVSSLIEAFLA